MKLSIAVQTPEVARCVPVALIAGSIEEKIAKAAEWGADGLELMTTDPRALDWDALRTCLDDHRIQVSAVASGAMAFAAGITLLHSDPAVMALAETRLYDLIDFAADLDAPVVTIGSFRGRLSALSDGEGLPRLQEILGKAAIYAGNRRVRLAVEAANRYELDSLNNHIQTLEFTSAVNHPALGVLLDTFHMNIEEASWEAPFERTLAAGKLFHVHLGDNNRLATGLGMIDFANIVTILRRGGYQGWLSAELLARPDPDTAARETIAHMRPLL